MPGGSNIQAPKPPAPPTMNQAAEDVNKASGTSRPARGFGSTLLTAPGTTPSGTKTLLGS